MSSRIGRRLPGVLLMLLVLATGPGLGKALAGELDDVAKVLAGLRPAAGSPLAAVAEEPGWQSHARAMDRAWAGLEARQLSRVRAWSARHAMPPRPTALYLFSGPDFLYADAFFGQAETYVLAGLEPVGRVPQISETTRRNLGPALGNLRGSLSALLSYSFFITREMKYDLRSRTFEGTVPLMLVFLARSGKTVQSARLIELDAEGNVQAMQGGERDAYKGLAAGVEIVFGGQDGKPRRLFYFRTDLSDGGIKSSGLLPFVERLGRVDALVKSASYLLFSGGFTRARQLLLEQADRIVQDDTGVPVAYFNQQDWDLRPFGRYLGPIGEFPGRYQARLAELFRRSSGPLDFGIGYRWRRAESNLMLAVRRSSLSATTGPTGSGSRSN